MEKSILQYLAECYHGNHELVLKLVDRLDDQQIAWRPNSTTPSIAFHVWHLARWADFMFELIAAPGTQIWDQEGLSERWGFVGVNLGIGAAGMGMEESVLARLPFPRKQILLDYACRAFAQADQAVSRLDEAAFHRRVQEPTGAWGKGPIMGDIYVSLITHGSEHLGMIECLVGVQGQPGTATN